MGESIKKGVLFITYRSKDNKILGISKLNSIANLLMSFKSSLTDFLSASWTHNLFTILKNLI